MKRLIRPRSIALFRAVAAAALCLASIPASAQTNTKYGKDAFSNNTTGAYNTAIGALALHKNTTGDSNTALGNQSLFYNTTGAANTAIGKGALSSNTTGNYNTANGYYALSSNTTGNDNTANGLLSLYWNKTGSWNTANGYVALYKNTTGSWNTANGMSALYSNTTGNNNTANGMNALYWNKTGNDNTANGAFALYANTTGYANTANGVQALYSNTGAYNIGIGFNAGYNLTNGSNNIAIGNLGVAAESGAIRIGTVGTQSSAYIAGINGVTSSDGVAVYINAAGQLGTITSSRRFKNDIKSMGSVSDRLLHLRPVTFRYKTADEKGGHPVQYGLIAEEVAKVFPDLVQYDKTGKPFTVRYHLLTPMILNELQKEKAARKADVANLSQTHKAQVTSLNAKNDALGAKVSAMAAELAQQKRLLNQLAAYVQNGKKNATTEKANFVQH